MKPPKKLTKKRIKIGRREVKAIQAECECVHSTVFQSLNYSTRDSELSKNIRRLALERYGGVVVETYTRPMTEEDI